MKYVRDLLGAEGMLDGHARWCFWLVDADPDDIRESTELRRRVSAVKAYRERSTRPATKELGAVAALFEHLPDQVIHLNFPRLFVLHELWRSFYTLSKYGKDRWGIPAKDLFKRSEAELAATHASDWNVAVNVLRSIIQQAGR